MFLRKPQKMALQFFFANILLISLSDVYLFKTEKFEKSTKLSKGFILVYLN